MADIVFQNSTSNAWICDFGVINPGIQLGWLIIFNTNSTIISSIGFISDDPEVEIVYSTTSIKSGLGDPDHGPDSQSYIGTIKVESSFPAQVFAVGVLTVL